MKQINIVLVENSRQDLTLLGEYIQEMFQPDGDTQLALESFLDPEKALEYVRTHECQLFITGVNLCGTDGVILSRRVQDMRPDIGIVLTTAYEEHVLQALQMCVHLQGYLSMPTSKEAVKKLLCSIFSTAAGK